MKCFDWCLENITRIVFLKNIQSQIMKYIVSFNLRQEVWARSKGLWLKSSPSFYAS